MSDGARAWDQHQQFPSSQSSCPKWVWLCAVFPVYTCVEKGKEHRLKPWTVDSLPLADFLS